MANNDKTAVEAYTEADRKLKILISQLDTRVENHKKLFIKDPKNWGYVGDINHWVETLDNMLNPK